MRCGDLVLAVTYRLGLFSLGDTEPAPLVDLVRGHDWRDAAVAGAADTALVTGHSVHVLVSPDTGTATPLTQQWRESLRPLQPLT